MTFKDILKKHIDIYTEHKHEDMYKLIYQGEFAGGHIISDEKTHFSWLKKECESVKNQPLKPIELISKNYSRIYLNGLLKTPLRISVLHRMIVLTADQNKGSMKGFEDKLNVWHTVEDSNQFILKMKHEKYPLTHHSHLYKHTYKPAYRIISNRLVFYMDLWMAIETLFSKQKQVVIAIDGDAGSGKSELANLIEHIYGAPVIHLDDFFLQIPQRTSERLKEVGGNIDYERFVDHVIVPLQDGKDITYQAYNCQTNKYGDMKVIKQNDLMVIEGSYSMHPKFINAYDIKVVLTVNEDIQLKRLKRRSSGTIFKRFINEWIPKEKAYAKAFSIQEQANLVFNTSNEQSDN